MALQIQQQFPIFSDIDGTPLNNGYIYIGTANLNPETNPIACYWDQALTLPAAQPFRTSGGYIVRNGNQALVYTNSINYSITVRNKNSALVYSTLTSLNSSAANISADDGAGGTLWTTIQGFINKILSSAGATIVGFLPAGTGGVATTVQAQLRLKPFPSNYDTNANYVAAVQALATNQNFAQSGAKIERIPDRLLVGNAIDNDGAFPNVLQDWLTQFQITTGLSSGTIDNTVLASLTQTSPASCIGILGGGQSLQRTGAGQSTMGIAGIVVNNNTTLATRVWGGYFEAHKVFGTAGTGCRGIEIDTRIETGAVEINPTPAQQTTSSALQLGSGAGVPTTANSVNTGAGIQILNNGTSFRKGIVFGNTSIEGTDGATGQGTAMALATLQSIDWYNNSNVLVGRIQSTNTAATNPLEIRFSASGIQYIQGAVNVFLASSLAGSPVNYINVQPALTTNSPVVLATGSDTNVDLSLSTKGTGVLRFGTYAATGDVVCNGYISIKDSGGTVRKLMTTA